MAGQMQARLADRQGPLYGPHQFMYQHSTLPVALGDDSLSGQRVLPADERTTQPHSRHVATPVDTQ